MVTRLTKGRGGFRKPIQLSLFIRDQLVMLGVSWGFFIYSGYKNTAQAIPKARGRGKRHVINYAGFSHYLYVLRKLGLIEYVLNPDGSIQENPAHQKSNPDIDLPDLPPARMIRIVPGREADPGWQNIWLAYRGGVPTAPVPPPTPFAPAPPPTPFAPAPKLPVLEEEEEALDIDVIKTSLTDLMDEGDKAKSIRALGKALDGLDEGKIGGIDGVREAIDEYREIGRAGITPEEYQEAKQRAFEFIQQTIDDLELLEE